MKKSLFVFLILVVAMSAIVACGVEVQVTTTTTTENITPEPPAHEHTVVVDEPVAATCTSTGLSAGASCSECGEIFVAQQEVPMIPHTEEIIPAVESTCTVAGLTEGKKCSVCDQILIAQTEAPLKAHTEEIIPDVNAACTTTGLSAGLKCSICNYIIIAQQEVPTLPHTYDDKYDESCNECGFIRDAECPHKEVETIQGYDASCTSTGLSNGSQCKKCGEILLAQQVLPIKGHSEVVIKGYDSTCTNTGLTNGIRCIECQNILVAQEIIPTKPHTDVLDEAVAPTCTSTGLTDGTHCGVCGAITRAQEVVDPAPHTESDWIIDRPTETKYIECLVCGKIIRRENVVIDPSTFALQPQNNNNFTVLGNGNAVLLSDLFTLNGVTAIPEGAQLVVHSEQEMAGNTYMKPNRGVVYTENVGGKQLSEVSLDWSKIDEDEINILLVDAEGTRISEDITVTVVDAVNARDYSEFALNDSNAFTKNVVLLSDVAMITDGYLTIGKNLTLYGNGYTFDVTAGRDVDGIISLKGTLRDVKIIGEVYPDFAFSRGDTYGSSAVTATNGAYIYNSYISNTRAPLEVDSGTVVIEDSVLFGGRYANVDMVGGTLTIKGTVTTVQQIVDAADGTKVIGYGISAWFNDIKKNVVIEDGANLVQYNFLDNSSTEYLAPLSLVGYDIMDLKEPFNHIFNNTAEYGNYVFTVNGVQYANSGMIATDKYSLDYAVTGSPSSSNIISGKTYKVGAIKTVTVETAVGDDEEFIISYDTRFTPKVGTVVSAGYVKVTGAQLKAGVQFEVNTQIKFSVLDGDGTGYMFQIQSDNYKTLVVDGADGYNSLTYTFTTDLSGKMGLVESVSSSSALHNKGLHYGKMCVDVYTFENTNTEYQQYLENYINMGAFYYPENYQFVGGQITNYSK